MKKSTAFLICLVLFSILFSVSRINVYAGNNDSLPSYGYTGKGDDGWKYTSHYSGMRISIFWAPDSEAFVTGKGVIQLGNTTDFSNTGPWYQVAAYTGYSIYWYMNQGNAECGSEYNPKLSAIEPYDWSGYDDDNKEIEKIVRKMPDVWTGTKAQWDNWFEGPKESRGQVP